MSSMSPLTWLIGQWANSAHVKFEVDLATRLKSPYRMGTSSVRLEVSVLWLKDMLCSLAELALLLTTEVLEFSELLVEVVHSVFQSFQGAQLECVYWMLDGMWSAY
jgi:hypothetical protein